MRPRLWAALVLSAAMVALTGCDTGDTAVDRGSSSELDEQIAAELRGRSFRQFDPSVDANRRKGVVLRFSAEVSLWAQYAENEHAVNEWEITSTGYRVQKGGGRSEYTLHFEEPSSTQELPTRCDDCIQTSGVSISVRDVFDSGKIRFRLNDPDGVLPMPFPVFESWTRFEEDEIIQ